MGCVRGWRLPYRPKQGARPESGRRRTARPSCQSLNGTALLCLRPHASSRTAQRAAAEKFILTTIARVAEGRRLRPGHVQGSLGRPLGVGLWPDARRVGGRLLMRKRLVPRVLAQIRSHAVCRSSTDGVRSSNRLQRRPLLVSSKMASGEGLPAQPIATK